MERIEIAPIIKNLPNSLHNPEVQVIIFGMLCLIGAWVVIAKVVQICLSLFWQIIVLFVLVVVLPNFSVEWFTEWIPDQIMFVVDWIQDHYEDYYFKIGIAIFKHFLELKYINFLYF